MDEVAGAAGRIGGPTEHVDPEVLGLVPATVALHPAGAGLADGFPLVSGA